MELDCTENQSCPQSPQNCPYRLYGSPPRGPPYQERSYPYPYHLPASSLISRLLKTEGHHSCSTGGFQQGGAAEESLEGSASEQEEEEEEVGEEEDEEEDEEEEEEGGGPLFRSPPRASKRGRPAGEEEEELYRQCRRVKRARGGRRRMQERQELKSQLDSVREQLLQLQEKVLRLHSGRAGPGAGLGAGPGAGPAGRGAERFSEEEEEEEEEDGQGGSRPPGSKLAEALKEELGAAVAQVIDGVVRMYAANQKLPPPPGPAPLPAETRPSPAPRDQGGPLPQRRGRDFLAEQLEALPLVVRKSLDPRAPRHPLYSHPPPPPPPPAGGLLPPPPPPQGKEPPSLLGAPFPPALPLPLLHYTMQMFASARAAAPPPAAPPREDRLSPDAFLELSQLLPPPPPPPPPHGPYPALHLLGALEGSAPKMAKADGGPGGYPEPGDPTLYLTSSASQEGLSPSHLKKAKLMFFYCRYPSSNTLKTYFPDVKFNRCITSQLIKWFSNFREFFYIQMEKFARQAAGEGVASPDKLSMSRDSELFRILNLHYNKANDFEVPSRFLEVAEVTLREFFSAIRGGRDGDPSWKKGIYKVICKLDSEIPEAFKSPGCPQELGRE
ncbi:prospero homeobox 3 [Lepisosteus oculatus]|uniref:prospero homeobox 3 n=1 Tax=Lepisosteus oculatus TaxID=7918 RepID=UPI0035F51C1B